MLFRFRMGIGLALLLSLLVAVPAFAGGWAVITLDELPTGVTAGEPFTIGFTVRQHGITPMTDIQPTVTATLAFAEKVVVYAEPEGDPGHYVATLTFPQAGNWEWSIQGFAMDQPMPALSVAASSSASPELSPARMEPRSMSISPLLYVRVLVFTLALIGLVFAFQRKSRLAGGLAALCLLAGLGTFMTGVAIPQVEAQGKESAEISIESSPSQVEVGRQLFLAKGCITCHYNDRAASRSEYWTIEMGAPNLTNYSSAPEVLFVRLKDPAAAKSDAKMPNLGLKKTEIEALIAFINSK